MIETSGVIFDMDGVIFDTECLWKNAFEAANQKYGLNLTEKYRQSTCGKSEQLIREELSLMNIFGPPRTNGILIRPAAGRPLLKNGRSTALCSGIFRRTGRNPECRSCTWMKQC